MMSLAEACEVIDLPSRSSGVAHDHEMRIMAIEIFVKNTSLLHEDLVADRESTRKILADLVTSSAVSRETLQSALETQKDMRRMVERHETAFNQAAGVALLLKALLFLAGSGATLLVCRLAGWLR